MDSKEQNVIKVFLKQITFSRSFGSKPQVVLKTTNKDNGSNKEKELM
jgi:hypothetical protein